MPEDFQNPVVEANPSLPGNNGQENPTPENKTDTGAPQATQAPEQGPEATTQGDELDVGQYLNNLPPEQRQVVEPVIKQWQSSYTKTRQKEKSELDNYRQYAEAFNTLRNYQPFLDWYAKETNKPKGNQTQPQQQEQPAPAPAVSSDISEEELSEAQVNPKKMKEIIERTARSIAQEGSQQFNTQHEQLRLQMELDAIARENPDFWQLDKAGILEPFLYYYTDMNKRPPIEAYIAAKNIWNEAKKEANAHATGMVQSQRQKVAEPPSTSQTQSGILWAENQEQAMNMAVEEALAGRKTEVRVKKK